MNRIINIRGYRTHKSLCSYLKIPQSTLSTWLSPNNQILPSLDKLDIFCDEMEIHTSDLFIPNSSFTTHLASHNNSMAQIKATLIELCMNRGLASIQSRVTFLFQPTYSNYSSCETLYYSYTRTKSYRCIPIQQLDEFAMRFNVETYYFLTKETNYEKN